MGYPPYLQEYIERVRASMPELPNALASRLRTQYGISEHDVNTLMSVDASMDIALDGERPAGSLVHYFERITAEGVDGKTAINWYVVATLP